MKYKAQTVQAERDSYTSQAGRTEAWGRMGAQPHRLYLSHLSAIRGVRMEHY